MFRGKRRVGSISKHWNYKQTSVRRREEKSMIVTHRKQEETMSADTEDEQRGLRLDTRLARLETLKKPELIEEAREVTKYVFVLQDRIIRLKQALDQQSRQCGDERTRLLGKIDGLKQALEMALEELRCP
jgi:hypothetical protein